MGGEALLQVPPEFALDKIILECNANQEQPLVIQALISIDGLYFIRSRFI